MFKILRTSIEYLRQLNILLAEIFGIIFVTRKIVVTLISIFMLIQGNPAGFELIDHL